MGGYALGQSFNHRRLANAGLADEYRVILRLAQQRGNNALDLGIATTDRLKLIAKRGSGQVAREVFKRVLGREWQIDGFQGHSPFLFLLYGTLELDALLVFGGRAFSRDSAQSVFGEKRATRSAGD
jgi:hypothetical protein